MAQEFAVDVDAGKNGDREGNNQPNSKSERSNHIDHEGDDAENEKLNLSPRGNLGAGFKRRHRIHFPVHNQIPKQTIGNGYVDPGNNQKDKANSYRQAVKKGC